MQIPRGEGEGERERERKKKPQIGKGIKMKLENWKPISSIPHWVFLLKREKDIKIKC